MARYRTGSREETLRLGRLLGKKLRGGQVLAFYGGLGAGKTTFVTGVAEGMGLACHVSSPTFAIVNVYGKNAELCHFDMYRVHTWDELYSTGFFDYLAAGSALCVEWSENIENALPEGTVRIRMQKGETDDERLIDIDGEIQ